MFFSVNHGKSTIVCWLMLVKSGEILSRIPTPPAAGHQSPFARTRCSSRGAPATAPGPPRGSGAWGHQRFNPMALWKPNGCTVLQADFLAGKMMIQWWFNGFLSVSRLENLGSWWFAAMPGLFSGGNGKASSKPWGEKTNSAQRQRQETFCSVGEMFQVWHSHRLVYEHEESSETASPLSVWTLKHKGCCLTCAADPRREAALHSTNEKCT